MEREWRADEVCKEMLKQKGLGHNLQEGVKCLRRGERGMGQVLQPLMVSPSLQRGLPAHSGSRAAPRPQGVDKEVLVQGAVLSWSSP